LSENYGDWRGEVVGNRFLSVLETAG